MEIKLRKYLTSAPSVAQLIGTNPKYGFERMWVSGRIQQGEKDRTYMGYVLIDGIFEIRHADGRRQFMVVVGNENTDLSDELYLDIAAYMRCHRCDRETAYQEIWESFSHTYRWMQRHQKKVS